MGVSKAIRATANRIEDNPASQCEMLLAAARISLASAFT
jgi:hypothetical protein